MSLRTSDRCHWRGNPFSLCRAVHYTLPMGTRIPTPVCAPARNDRCVCVSLPCASPWCGATGRCGHRPLQRNAFLCRKRRNSPPFSSIVRRGEVTPPYDHRRGSFSHRFAYAYRTPRIGRTESFAPTKFIVPFSFNEGGAEPRPYDYDNPHDHPYDNPYNLPLLSFAAKKGRGFCGRWRKFFVVRIFLILLLRGVGFYGKVALSLEC